MKLRIIYFLFFCLLTLGLFLNYKNGPAGAEEEDRTGGPFSEAPCQTCHTAGAFSPNLMVELLDGDNAVTQYEPGKTYSLKATISANASAAVFGFQALFLKDSDNTNAGAFGDAPEGMAVVELDGRQYAEHNAPSTENTFEIDWTAPEAGTGDVNIYAACVAGNNNNATSGDGSVFLNNPIVLTELVTDAGDIIPDLASFDILGNPVQDLLNLNIQVLKGGAFQLNILNTSGQVMRSRTISLLEGENLERVDLSGIPAGTYFVQIRQNNTYGTRKFVKL